MSLLCQTVTAPMEVDYVQKGYKGRKGGKRQRERKVERQRERQERRKPRRFLGRKVKEEKASQKRKEENTEKAVSHVGKSVTVLVIVGSVFSRLSPQALRVNVKLVRVHRQALLQHL